MEKEEIKKMLKILWDDALNGKDFELSSLIFVELFHSCIRKKNNLSNNYEKQ